MRTNERMICKGLYVISMIYKQLKIFTKTMTNVVRNSKRKLPVVKPPSGPSLGISRHGPDFRNLAMPKTEDNNDVTNAITPNAF